MEAGPRGASRAENRDSDRSRMPIACEAGEGELGVCGCLLEQSTGGSYGHMEQLGQRLGILPQCGLEGCCCVRAR